ncbi:hypothetical protein AX16_005523 [Volvariella volvacea WC 439]|nr:hypothetical protein AX16_005523 [Volvariella volvacea WC 439]
MDARIEPARQLGINLGDAHIIRNAGGSPQEAIRSIVISQRLLGTKEIAVFRHTGCGMLTFTTPQLQQIVRDAAPGDSSIASAVNKIDFLEFSNLEEAVKSDVEFLKSHPLVLKETTITGWIYDVETGKSSPPTTYHSISGAETMSYAASKLELESPRLSATTPGGDEEIPEQEHVALKELLTISPPTQQGPVIAIDLDDVLSQTNHKVAEWHNQKYGTNMDISHFYYYYYWKNPFWGTPNETFTKVQDFYAEDHIFQADPVVGAREGVQTLRNMGFKLIIVTARGENVQERSWKWVNDHFPGIFDSVICTGQFKDAHKRGHEVVTRLSKAQVCNDLGAQLLIDDSAENSIQCATADPPVKVLLFGDYEWNKRISGHGDATDEMAFDNRLKANGGKEFWKEETLDIPDGVPLWRVKDWGEVIRWVRQAISDGTIPGPASENP